MKRVTVPGLAWAACGITASLGVGTLALVALNHGGNCCPNVVGATAGLIYAAVGALIVSRGQRIIGWCFVVAGFFAVIAVGSEEYLLRALVHAPGSLPAPGLAAWLLTWAATPAISAVLLVFLLFPDGRPHSPRWRPVVWSTIAGGVLEALGLMFAPGRVGGSFNNLGAHISNPLGVPPLRGVLPVLMAAGTVILTAAGAGALLSLILRFRRSRGDEREQLRWLAYVPFAAILCLGVLALGTALGVRSFAFEVTFFLLGVSAAVIGVPAAAAVAILKYRLYGIDVVINKTTVYAALAAFITAVYVAIVVGIGHAVGQGHRPNLGLSILATAVVAVAFQPVRDRVQHFANRLVYGKRATPYEVLSEFSGRMSGAYAAEDLLPRMAKILAEGTGAARADVWLRVGAHVHREASWPSDSSSSEPIALVDGDVPAIDGLGRLLPVRHRGELLGALSVTKPRGDPLRPAEEKLMEDLASGAGLVLRNVRLTAELLHRLEELQASRLRIVSAQDEERRRLERNIHDGAQQQLVALQVKLSLAERLAEEDCRVRDALAGLKQEAGEALENLRDLARGIYPPLLADHGLTAALTAQARKGVIPVVIEADGIGRYHQEHEAALYFCVLEALQNVAKYAGATHAVVRLHEDGGHLAFEVEDDGSGFDTSTTSYGTGLQGMADRLSARGGTLEVRSHPGEGTTVTGRVPVGALELAG
jgi:signal transduction histidine kinase